MGTKVAPRAETGDEKKKDDGKPRFDLIPPEALEALAHLYRIGAEKYRPRGWEEGMDWGRIYRAMIGHANKWWAGETYDQIDGQHHLSSVAWCAFALFTYEMVSARGKDDRPNS